MTDPNTLGPLVLGFATQTYDIDIGNTNVLGGNHILTYGANYRRNNFDITLAEGPDRDELGAYAHWEYFVKQFRFAVGGRVDKFGNLDDPVFSPRVSVMFKPTPEHSIRTSYNKAFVSPSFINNYLNQDIQYPTPVDLTPLAAVVPPIAPLIPPPFLLTVNAFGNPGLREQSTDSYELAYTGTFGGGTTVGLAAYLSDSDDNINFTYLVPPGTPGYPPPTYYSVTNPAKGVTIPTATTPSQPITLSPVLMGILAQVPPQLGGPILLPEKVATYLNLGPIRNKGIEASLDHRFSRTWSAFANYSWQDVPQILDAGAGEIPFPAGEVGIPSKHRFNFGLEFKRADVLRKREPELRGQGALGGRAQRRIRRVYRQLRHAQRGRGREAGRRQVHVEPQGYERHRREDPAAHLRRCAGTLARARAALLQSVTSFCSPSMDKRGRDRHYAWSGFWEVRAWCSDGAAKRLFS